MKENLTIEQQIIDYLTYMKVMTRPYVLDRALKDQEYAKEIITGNGLSDEIEDAGMGYLQLPNNIYNILTNKSTSLEVDFFIFI